MTVQFLSCELSRWEEAQGGDALWMASSISASRSRAVVTNRPANSSEASSSSSSNSSP